MAVRVAPRACKGRPGQTGRPKYFGPEPVVASWSTVPQPGINQSKRKLGRMTARPKTLTCAALVACALVAGCGRTADQGAPVDRDPALIAALAEPLMTDPDLSQANVRNLVADPGGPSDGSLPALGFAPDEAALASAEAQALTGGRLRLPGMLAKASPRLAAAKAVPKAGTLAERVRVLVDAGPCTDRLGHGFAWGVAMGAALPIYPRAHLVEGVGVKDHACHIIAASFLTPVAPQPLMAFYHARARKAGYADAASVAGDAALLEGAKGAQRFAVLLRNAGHGVTSVDLILREK